MRYWCDFCEVLLLNSHILTHHLRSPYVLVFSLGSRPSFLLIMFRSTQKVSEPFFLLLRIFKYLKCWLGLLLKVKKPVPVESWFHVTYVLDWIAVKGTNSLLCLLLSSPCWSNSSRHYLCEDDFKICKTCKHRQEDICNGDDEVSSYFVSWIS